MPVKKVGTDKDRSTGVRKRNKDYGKCYRNQREAKWIVSIKDCARLAVY